MPSRLQFSHSHAWEVDTAGNYILDADGARQVKSDGIADNPFKVYYDHWSALVRSGLFWTGYTSIGQRQGNTNYNVSFENNRNEGVIFGLGGYTRQNFRVNVDHQLRSNVDASFSSFFGRSTNGRAAEGQNGPFYGLMFLQPDVNIKACCNPDGSPYIAKIPLGGDVANDFNPLARALAAAETQDREEEGFNERSRKPRVNRIERRRAVRDREPCVRALLRSRRRARARPRRLVAGRGERRVRPGRVYVQGSSQFRLLHVIGDADERRTD